MNPMPTLEIDVKDVKPEKALIFSKFEAFTASFLEMTSSGSRRQFFSDELNNIVSSLFATLAKAHNTPEDDANFLFYWEKSKALCTLIRCILCREYELLAETKTMDAIQTISDLLADLHYFVQLIREK